MPRALDVMAREWESLNAKAELARMHRDGHCHEAVKWYVHHLPESMKTPMLCECKGRRPKNRSLSKRKKQSHAGRELPKGDDPRTDQSKGVHSYLPGWQPKETAS